MQRWMTGALVGLVACGAPGGEPPETASGDSVAEAPAEPLASSLSVQVTDDSVHFRLDVTNTTTGPLVLEFASAQRFDVTVESGSGESVWSWSADRMFAQVLESDTVAAGGTLTYGAAWSREGRTGTYTARAHLVSLSHPVELETEFELTEQ